MNRLVSSAPASLRRLGPLKAIPALRRDEVVRDGAALAIAAGFSSLLMVLYQVVVARELQPAAYATFGALLGINAIVAQVGNAFQLTAARDVARLSGSNSGDEVTTYVSSSTRTSFIAAAVLLVILLPLVPVFSNALGISSYMALGITFVASASYLPLSTLRGNLQGLQRFRPLSLNRVGEKAVLIFAGGVLVLAGFGVNGAILGLIASVVAMIVYAIISMGHYGRPTFSGIRPARLIKPSVVVLATALGVAALANIDSLIAKSVFPDDEAGVFNAIGRLGKILFFIALAFNRALFPKSVRLQAQGRSSRGMLLRSMGVMAAASLLIVPLTVPVAHPLINLSLGHNYAGSSGLVPWYFGAMGVMAMVSMLMYYNVAVGNRGHLWPLGVGLCVLCGLFILKPNSPFQLIAAMILTYIVVFAITLYSTLRTGKQRQLAVL